MIDVKVKNGIVDIREMQGNGFKIMAELCTVVNVVCEAYTDDITDGTAKVFKSEMIKKVADTLKWGEEHNVF